jgi:hypothetical protein
VLRAFAIAVVAAGCARPIATPTSLANSAEHQRLRPLVVDEFSACTTSHRIQISVDATRVATVAITCPPPQPPMHGPVVVVVCDGVPRTFDGPVVAIAAGWHTIAVRDELTGRTAQFSAQFPVTRADTILIGDYDRSTVVGVGRRALLILM